jgi:hypothetical protein
VAALKTLGQLNTVAVKVKALPSKMALNWLVIFQSKEVRMMPAGNEKRDQNASTRLNAIPIRKDRKKDL